MPPKNKGNFAKGRNRNPIGRTLRADHGSKAFRDIDWDLKTNGRSVAGNMPLLSEFTNYADWDTDAGRWAMMLHNPPESTGGRLIR